MAANGNQTDYSCFPSSSSSPLWNVFVSFHGEDTRKNFTGHLYVALDQAGIRTFKDDSELRRGEEISSELLKAIQSSKMSIIVFSKNYAYSRWCLDELAEILKCKRTKRHAVLPIFYDVDPSDLRHQTGSFAEAFRSHEIQFVDDIDKVDRWKAALTEAANLSGYHLKNDANGHEAEFIQKIVKNVLQEVYPNYLNVAEHLVGIDSRVKEICQKLSIGSNDHVHFIGIYGMAGIGKTTIVKAIYNKTFHQYESSCFLENVRETLEEPRGIHSLLEQLIFELLKIKNFKVANVESGISLMKQTLRSKKVLVVLDDLDHLSQIQALAGHWNWFGLGSRIVITTRDARLLDKIQVEFRYEVKELDNNESLELFSMHAFRNTVPLKDFMELSQGIVSYTGGLPLALEVLGSNLFRRTMLEWKSLYRKLQQIPDNQIQKKLRISYDALDDDKVRDIFLDIACFLIGMDKNDAINILDECNFFPEIGISILRERCLLKIDEGNKLRMHNLIRDMGREIVREESLKNPSRRSRLWFHEDAYDVLKNLKGTKAIEGIKLVMPMPNQVHVSTRIFGKIHNLRLLQISNVHLTGSFKNLFGKLRWLCWHYSPLECLPSSFHPPKLVFLDMQYSNVKILWQGTKHLQHLKILDASHSQFLTTTPNFRGVERLEKLLLRCCSSLLHIHPSIGHLSNLVHLDLNKCFNLNRLPEQLGNMEGLRKLDASGTAIEQLPDSIGHLGRLVELYLEGCENLKNIPSSICHLTSLKVLILYSCSNLQMLPEKLGNMECLWKLVAGRTAIEQLPDSIGRLSSLENLSLVECWNLQQLPPNLENMECLKNLAITFTSMEQLPNLSSLKHLERLHLEMCSNLESLPELPFNLYSLRMSDCTSLQSVPKLPPNLHDLQLNNCSRLRSLAKLPPNLGELDLTDCNSLESLPVFPPDLAYLNVSDCRSLRSLTNLPKNLCFFYARDCTSLEKLPNLSYVKYLRTVVLINCINLTFNLKENFLEDYSGFQGYDVYLPSRDIQDWFSHQRTGSSISFQLPLHAKKEILGIAFWAIYGDETYSLIQVVIVNKTDGTEFKFSGSIWTTGVHSWVSYIPKPFSIRSGDRIEVYYRGVINEDVKVEMCGVHLVYKPDMTKIDYKRDRDINDVVEKSCHSKRLKFLEENWNSMMSDSL